MTDWREDAHSRSASRGRRRNAIVLLLIALTVVLAALAAFAIPMLVTS